jgi:fructose-bisphosphate aldolase class I
MGKLPWSYFHMVVHCRRRRSAWHGKEGQFAAGQRSPYKRAKLNSLAHLGKYESAMEPTPPERCAING